MSALAQGIRARYRTARILIKGGANLRSVIFYPIRHRLPSPRHQIDLTTGLSIISPMSEPLSLQFEDIWVKHCFTPGDFKIAPSDTVVDIGSNLGVFSIWAVTRAQGVRVIALEPSPRMFPFLVQNLSRNGLRQVVAVQAACGGESGTAVLYSYGQEEGASLLPRNIRGKFVRPLARVEVLTLDDVFRRHEVKVCNLLKLNCEGAEYEILFTASKETLRAVRKVSMIYHLGLDDHCPAEMTGFLRQHGFEVTCIPPYDELGGYLYARRHV